tara:strand:+ start:586 stop:771 length:186 start_codon:yes stop_codon:yes gene_type:complete
MIAFFDLAEWIVNLLVLGIALSFWLGVLFGLLLIFSTLNNIRKDMGIKFNILNKFKEYFKK